MGGTNLRGAYVCCFLYFTRKKEVVLFGSEAKEIGDVYTQLRWHENIDFYAGREVSGRNVISHRQNQL